MPVKFSVTSKRDPRDLNAQPKYYAIVRSDGRDDLNAVAQKVARVSTASTGDTALVLETFVSVVPEQLADGKIVELGDFGSFRLSVSSEGSASSDEVSARNITGVKVIFTPGKRFKQALETIQFQKVAE